ncbi:MAG: hypothetical protein A2937_00365 [Candidatus Yonathbacteria bacterium RIFCSPLOWO2_01_FULL_47_33b]|uniref:TrbL/VirB6 plasmid conjugal transfer protein n=1 Tax=Candidatus Yonathbacteria bacterium RIFCSPLOWO2_01_FULL_47_33b TaxID=1802727 RepID=A0A1G2SHH3_9BACT|nr:MAG: hypothetical protein A2937_00365 [Candidatus Yonathbacteria bacterium RIFCSPLOWO2_01_FULL_47_33b]
MSTTLSKSIAILLGVVFFAAGTLFASAAPGDPAAQQPVTAQQAGAYKYTYTGSNGSPITLPEPTLAGCEAAVANRISAGFTITQQCTFVAGASAPTTASNLSPAAIAAAVDPNLVGINCNITDGWIGEGKFADCIPVVVYYLIYKPASYLLIGSGYIFDKTIALSIDKTYVSDPAFINDSWKIIRDFSNMLFIFILLYTGIMTMFGSKDWKRTVIQVVIIALLINFSLFFTKVVIDAGNILATGVYSSINTGTSFSASLASKFQPQVFLDTAGQVGATNATIVFIIAAIVSVFAAYVFFKAALLFIGRLLAFWFLMIVSPFAFISTAFPKGNKFQEWFSLLLNQAFVAPVFLFMLYIIMQVLTAGNGILSSIAQPSGSSWFNSLIAPILIAVLIIVALQKSLKFAESMAGDFGQLGAKIGGAVLGVAGGAVLGGAAVAGRATVGRAAQRLEESGKLRQMATSDSKFARFAGRNLMGVTDKVRQGTFDARGMSTVQKAAGAAGVASIGKPWASAKGGFEGEQKRQGEADEKFAKRLEMTADEIELKHGLAAKEKEANQQEAREKELKGRAEETKKKLAEAEKTGDAATISLAKATSEKAEAELAEANEITKNVKNVLAETKAAIKKENSRRAGKFAEHVEGRNFIPSMGTYSRKQAQQTADKIRKGESKDEKAQKDWEKKMKKMFEGATKGEEKPEEGAKKAEEPAH